MNALKIVNLVITIVFMLCYTHQFLYVPVPWLRKEGPSKNKEGGGKIHVFAVLICARNEETVIGDLIDSIKRQTYPMEHVHVFVMADNCTDRTATVSASHGAKVYFRHDRQFVGKGYALDALLKALKEDYPMGFDAYLVLDADNLLDPGYIEAMNKKFSEGHDIITSYRNSKNFGDNWISAGYALWFLRESRYLNHARYLLGSSCAVSGTGFLFSKKIADEMEGWPYHTLTEDIEFSIAQIVKGRRIAFCKDAVLYDEQPTEFRQSWRQRMRWSKGYLQVFGLYGRDLLKGISKGNFSCFDMSANIMPAFILSVISIVSNISLGIWGALIGDDMMIALRSFGQLFVSMYSVLFLLGTITTISEWRQIHASAAKKILYTLTFPLFMFTYIPIAFSSLFCKGEWKPIRHCVTAKMCRQLMSK